MHGNDLTGTLPTQLGNLSNLETCYLSYSEATKHNSFDCELPANLPAVCNIDNTFNSFVCSPVVTGSNGDPHLNFADGGKADERVERASSPVHGACTPLELAPAASPQAGACPGSLCFTHAHERAWLGPAGQGGMWPLGSPELPAAAQRSVASRCPGQETKNGSDQSHPLLFLTRRPTSAGRTTPTS